MLFIKVRVRPPGPCCPRIPSKHLADIMKQETPSRLLPVAGAYNMRDLGGYTAAGNKHVKWKTIIRSDELSKLTETDLDYLDSLPLLTVIDFRGKKEQNTAPDKLPSSVKHYYPLTLEAGDMSSVQKIKDIDGAKLPALLEEVYAYIIRNSQPVYKEFFRILAKQGNTPLLFHCSAGKDRTGIAAALFLASLGVDRETIMEDYLLSARYIKGKYEFLTRTRPELEPLTTVKKEYLEAAFHVIDEEFGGLENYLRNQLDVDIEKMRELYTAS